MRSTNSAYFTRLQQDGFAVVELIELITRGKNFYWTTCNFPITYTLSGAATQYDPFPGQTLSGVKEDSNLNVSVIDFIVSNTGEILRQLLPTEDLDFAQVQIGRVFPDTPDLGRMEIGKFQLGDYSYDRNSLTGQARSQFKSAQVRWPHYNYQDNCGWRFGSTGCGFNTSSITLALGSIDATSSTAINLLLNSGTISASYSAGRFNFGRVTVTGGVNSGHVRTIRSHTGDLLMLSHALPVSSFTPMSLSIFPGCRKRLIPDCHSLYNNAANFLGWPWIPIQEDGFVG